MKILSIDTSCDETAAAVTQDTTVLSNVIYSQIAIHQKYGGVFPNLAKRAHEEHIEEVVTRALRRAFPASPHPTSYNILSTHIDALAVTAGPGLAIALGVGINYARELAQKYKKPLIPVNHIEGHTLSPIATGIRHPREDGDPINNGVSRTNYRQLDSRLRGNDKKLFPAISLVASGKTTQVILIRDFGDYTVLATTMDDALGEALDKGARMLGLGYPGGPIMEKMAKEGDPTKYHLPLPMQGRESEGKLSYSGLKTAMFRLVEQEKPLNKEKIQDLAAVFQDVAFDHYIKVAKAVIQNTTPPIRHAGLDPASAFKQESGTTSRPNHKSQISSLLIGGGVAANLTLRKKMRQLAKSLCIPHVLLPYSKKLYTDNAAMIGIAAFYRAQRGLIIPPHEVEKVDRVPRARIDERFGWEKV